MIFLKSIHLDSFKGVENLTCTFDDLTILSGLNNAGKTSVLEAIHILIGSISQIADHPHKFHEKRGNRLIALQDSYSSLGQPDANWLMPFNDWAARFQITAVFHNDVKLTISQSGQNKFYFDVEFVDDEASNDVVGKLAHSLHSLRSDFNPSTRDRRISRGFDTRSAIRQPCQERKGSPTLEEQSVVGSYGRWC